MLQHTSSEVTVTQRVALQEHQKQFRMEFQEINFKVQKIVPTQVKFHYQFHFTSTFKRFI